MKGSGASWEQGQEQAAAGPCWRAGSHPLLPPPHPQEDRLSPSLPSSWALTCPNPEDHRSAMWPSGGAQGGGSQSWRNWAYVWLLQLLSFQGS